MSLTTIFRELYASAATGRSAYKALGQGATIRVRADGRRRQVILGRRGASIGLGEDATFRRDGRIPAEAVGVCWFATASGEWLVSYTWEERTLTLPLEDLPPTV